MKHELTDEFLDTCEKMALSIWDFARSMPIAWATEESCRLMELMSRDAENMCEQIKKIRDKNESSDIQ